ncbi:MAG: metal-dependent hydrolase [Planctomycetota bacterium]|jgi:membrane-bound metal-dependent hydrolase YbcI (DUF457 family)
MYLGHFAVGFGAKAAAPRVSLGTMFLAAQWVDLLWPTLLLLGWERVAIAPGITRVTPLDFVSYPITHSLLAALGWASLFTLVFWRLRRSRSGALVVGLAVLSHWLLDLVTHRPDLPLYPGGFERVGLGLWSSLSGTILLEAFLLAAGLMLYLRATAAKDRVGVYGFWSLVAFLVLTYLANLFGPPPPSVEAIAWVGQAQWILVLWAYWVDRHRAGTARGPRIGA